MKDWSKYDYYVVHSNNKQGHKCIRLKKCTLFCHPCGEKLSDCKHSKKSNLETMAKSILMAGH